MSGQVLRMYQVQIVRGGRTVLAVADLAVEADERVAIVGPNGSGKSTLLLTMALLHQPSAGTVHVGGELATRANARALRRHIGLVFQDPMLFRGSVRDNVGMAPRFNGIARDERERRVTGWLEHFGIAGLADRRADRLSGGEAQRVALARALVMEPSLLLLDEPFAALDPATRASVAADLVTWLGATRGAAVLVTHDLGEALAFGGTLGVLSSGAILQHGPAGEVMARPSSFEAARLLGVENLLPGRFVRDDRSVVALDGWGDVRVGSAVADAGDAPVVLIRAGAIRLLPVDRPMPEGWSGLEGRVSEIGPMPASNRVVVRRGDHSLVVAVPWSRGWLPAIGEAVIAAVPPEAVHVVPSGARGVA